MPAGNAGSPNTKYLYYQQGMEDITLKDPFLSTLINQKLVIRTIRTYHKNYLRDFNSITQVPYEKNPTLSVENFGPLETKNLYYPQLKGLLLPACINQKINIIS